MYEAIFSLDSISIPGFSKELKVHENDFVPTIVGGGC